MKEKRMVPFLSNEGMPLIAKSVGRNEKCECGSGLKSKKCCNKGTKYFITKKPVDLSQIKDN